VETIVARGDDPKTWSMVKIAALAKPSAVDGTAQCINKWPGLSPAMTTAVIDRRPLRDPLLTGSKADL
jgi:hypothetical protein